MSAPDSEDLDLVYRPEPDVLPERRGLNVERRRADRRTLPRMTTERRGPARREAEPIEALDLALPSEEAPFLRPARRTPVRRPRRGPLGRLLLAARVAGAVLVVVWAGSAGYARVMASERLKVSRVDVRGSRFLSEGEVRELLGPAVGMNILTLDMDGLTRRLEASPWVAEARVTRTLPDALRVEVREREPLALAELERLYLMDASGQLIDLYGPRTSGFDLPIVRGLGGLEPEPRRARAEVAAALLDDLGDLAPEVSEVEVEASGDVRLVLRGPGEVLLMGPPPHRPKLETFLRLRRDLAERAAGAEYFDLRFRDRIYAKTRLPEEAGAPSAGGKADPRPDEPPRAPPPGAE